MSVIRQYEGLILLSGTRKFRIEPYCVTIQVDHAISCREGLSMTIITITNTSRFCFKDSSYS